MKKIILLMLVSAVALSACRKAPFEEIEEPQATITLNLSISESSITQTKAQSADEVTLNNLWVFVFNSSNELVYKYKATEIKGDVKKATIAIPEGVNMRIIGYGNVSAVEELKFDRLVNNTPCLSELKAIKTNRLLLNTPGLPMWGELTNQTITNATTAINMTLNRSCSRLDVVANNVPDFSFSGIEKLLKTAEEAPIYPASSLVAASSTVGIVPTIKTLGSIYLYENAIVAGDEATAEAKATAVIIKGRYKGIEGYYKLRVNYSSPVKYDIGRNTIYSINISSAKAPGFATLAESEANYPQNIDYSVTATDADATDLTTSNGQYYLGVSNSEYMAYHSEAMSNVTVVTITHNAPSSITTGTIAAAGVGLTLKTTTIPTSTQKQEVKVDMTAGFRDGVITLRLGNLMKYVIIKKRSSIGFENVYNSDYSATTYVQGDLDEVTPSWFRLGKTSNALETTRRVQNLNGGLWIYFNINIGSNNTTRTSGAYLSSIDSKGRIRIVARQESAIFQYLNGIPTESLPAINAPTFILNVKTDLAGWTIGAYDNAANDVALTFGTKTGNPVKGTPADCSIPITIPNNSGVAKTINFYMTIPEKPTMKIWFGNVPQNAGAPIISLNITSQANILGDGSGSYAVKVTSNAPWTASSTVSGVTFSPTTGGAARQS